MSLPENHGHSTAGNGETTLATSAAEANGTVSRRTDAHPIVRVGEYETMNGFDLKKLFQILRRRMRVAIAVFLAVFVVITAWTLTSKRLYKAIAKIQMINSDDGSSASIPGLGPLLPSALQDRQMETEIEVIKSDEVKQAALQKLSPEHRKILGELPDIQVDNVRDTDLIGVSVTSTSKAASVACANTIAETYINQSRESNQRQMRDAAEFIANQITKISSDLDKARRELEAYKKQAKISDPLELSRVQTVRQSQLESDITTARADRKAAVARLAVVRSTLRSVPREQRSNFIEGDSPAAASLKNEIASFEIKRVAAIKEFAPGSPEIHDIDSNLAALRVRLSNEVRSEIKQQTTNVNPLWASKMQESADLSAQLAALSSRETALASGLSQLRVQLSKMPEVERRLATLMAKVGSLESSYASFQARKAEVDVKVVSRQSNGVLKMPAAQPKRPVSPAVVRNIMLGFMLGILLAIACAVLIDILDDRIHSDDDVRHASGLPVLTHVPVIKDVAHQTLLGLPGVREGASTSLATTASYHGAPLLESFRMLRANLMFSATVEPIRSIVVTSSRPSEGKSSCAVNLAVALALDGKSVILVDCDLRRPKAHDLLSLRNAIGFTSVVTGQVALADALQSTGVANLKVLTGGPVPPNPTELLNSRAGRACLQQLMSAADFVILDTPPALVMADAQMVASQADAVLMVVSANEADKREVARTTELMAQTGARLLGTVLIKSDTSTGGYYNYSTYSQYYATPVEEEK